MVVNTDYDWLTHLRNRPDLPEVNFWSPSARSFRALQAGELFLFRLKAPHRRIAGGGIFAYSNEMPISLAWDAFGEANGASSFSEMGERISRLRSGAEPTRNFDIGCRILTQPFFFDEHDWFDAPSFQDNIVTFKTYSTAEEDGRQLWTMAQERMQRQAIPTSGPPTEPQIIRPRLGQGAFRVRVTDLYERRCAVTRESTLPALAAAHIIPRASGGTNEASNGILLRRDIHSLFNEGYVTVTPSLEFRVSRAIREEFENGRAY